MARTKHETHLKHPQDNKYHTTLPLFTISSDSVMKNNRERQNKICASFPNLLDIRKDTENKRKSYLQFVENMLNQRIRYYTFEIGKAKQARC